MPLGKLFQLSLKSRISLLTLAVFLVGVWSIAFYATQRLQRDMLALLGTQQFSAVSTVAGQLDNELRTRLQALDRFAGEVPVALMSDAAGLQKYIATRTDLLALFNGGIRVNDAAADTVASMPYSPERIGANYADRDYMVTALRDGRTSIGRPILGRVLNAPVLGLAAPIRDGTGAIVGAVVGAINLGEPSFFDSMTNSRLGQSGGYLLIAPQHGLIVTGTDKSRTMSPMPPLGVNRNHDRFVAGYEGYGVAVSSRGVEEIAAAKRIPAADWFLVGTLPTAEALAPIHATQRRVMGVAALFSVLAGLVAWLLVRHMLRRQFAPMVSATQALSGMAQPQGAALQPLAVLHDDEVGQLIVSFNRLIESVRRNEEALKQDIVERMRVEAALRASEEKHRVLFETSRDAIMTLAPPSWRFATCNRAAITLFGADDEADFISRTPWDYSPALQPDGSPSAAKAREMMETALAEGSLLFEWEHRRLNGETFLTSVLLSRFELGGHTMLQAHVRDITERRKAEESMRLAANVFTHAREGIVITDRDANILEVNPAFTDITGYQREDVLGQNPRILSSGKQDQAFYAAMWQELNTKGCWSGEVWNRRKDGRVYAEMLTISAVRDERGEIKHFISLLSDITALKEYQNELEHIAHYDGLTGLPNRLLLADRLRQAMNQAPRRNKRVAVAYLDLDGFKSINDNHGHEVGDHLLATLAKRLAQVLRNGDTLSRIGGDEFVAVFVDLPDHEASVPMLTRLLDAAAQPVAHGDTMLHVSASLGVTFFPQSEEIDADQLLRQADQAMYQAKQAGKNRYHIFDAEQDRNVRGLHESLEHVRQALAQRQFVLHYQPKVNMRTGALVGAEALIRWQHPQRGLLPPAAFLPVIEGHPLAIDVGEWVIDTALQQIEAWRTDGLSVPVSVNVGALQLQQADFVSRLRALMARHPGVQPGELELEILETSALEDIAVVSQVMEACQQMGIGFALDDFGTGYSSLSYLKQLPAGLLKIDRSFVRDMLNDPEDLAILEGVLGLARAFRRQTIAEGVETLPHGEMLLRMGCEWGQGYAIARPMPAQDLKRWVGSWKTPPSWQAAAPISQDRLPVLFAAVEQRAWMAALVDYLSGDGDRPAPPDTQQYRFGHLPDKATAATPGTKDAGQAVDALQRDIHRLAAALVALKREGRTDEVRARIGELNALHDRLVEQLNLLG
ncbi:MAG TPA: EAL domain-containing protein [Thauera sp.]|nr:EAL domain-containing protein [Thauera sp.]